MLKTHPRAAAGLQQLSLLARALAVSLLLSWPLQLADAQTTPEQRDKMVWVAASNPMALCNDFTRAGFFIRRNTASDKWVVFLESGGLCYDRESCNRRFFVRTVRERPDIRDDSQPEIVPYGRFDPLRAWRQTVYNDPAAARRTISPLMSSMQCFLSGEREIEGRDILDTRPSENELFHDYNHVLIPYCSSDVWLGEETSTTNAVRSGASQCSCFNYTTSSSSGCFDFLNSNGLLFTFRGKTIYQSVIRQLLADYGLMDASKVILAGSSAGGVGVVNHAEWTSGVLNRNTELNVFADSAWFIDYQDGIESVFNLATNENRSLSSSDTERLLDVLESQEACNDTDMLGYPCCISVSCVLTQRNSSGELQFYPENTPTFVLLSLYDIYLLAPGLAMVADLRNSMDAASNSEGTGAGGLGVVLDFLRVVGEYAGTMNNTLDLATNQASFLSSYVTPCFQHIYLATSTLWGSSAESVLGSDSIEFTRGTMSFSHSIASGRWSTDRLTSGGTILDALIAWQNGNGTVVSYTDSCRGILCNDQCPDQLLLGQLTSDNWPLWSKIFITVLVVGLATVCMLIKMAFVAWVWWLERKQDAYLESLEGDEEETDAKLQFPACEDDDAVAVSCLNLYYSVKFKAKKAIKDEKKDQTAPIVLSNIADQDSDSETEEDNSFSHRRTTRYRRLSVSSRRQSQFNLPSRLLKKTTSYFSNTPAESPSIELRNRGLSSSSSSSSRRSRSGSNVSPSKKNGSSKKPLAPKQQQSFESMLSNQSGDQTPVEEMKTAFGGRVVKEILKGISIYFNPGEMIGIMGPSGCGKTTFLDLLTARRKTGNCKGEIYINGIPIEEIRDWYVANTGYVLQLAAPYYEELTVRENLTLAAQMKLPKTFTMREKFERVEQVMEVTGLLKLADTPVGGATGPGLSGGQKKRLVVALQLLKLPSVIFLDEPTSGLDATASFELLTHLNKLADSNRTVILTIHQPRLEIFHMFHRLVLLSDGKVSYHGAPEKAYEVFVSALTSRYLEQGLIIPSLEDHNPADVIMDMLGNFKMRQIITENYQSSKEPRLVERAIRQARWKEYSISVTSVDSLTSTFKHIIKGAKNVGERHGSNLTRIATLEARASKRVSLSVLFFLPFMFALYAFVLGTTYIQVNAALLVIAGVCVFSTASALFMFPAMYLYYQPALNVYSFEKGDGIGRAHDLVIQGFVRFQSISFLPIIFSATMLYLLLVNAESYQFLVYLQVVLTNVALNQTWIALLIALICAFPAKAFRLSPIIAAVAGFSSGFFIPVGALHWGYRWLVYINPNYFGLSSVAFFVLSDFDTQCRGSQLECYATSGPQVLSNFFFDNINPYLHIIILFSFTIFYLLLAVFANWVRHTSIASKLRRVAIFFNKSARDSLTKEFDQNYDEYERTFSIDSGVDDDVPPYVDDGYEQNGPLSPVDEAEEEEYETESEEEGEGERGGGEGREGGVEEETGVPPANGTGRSGGGEADEEVSPKTKAMWQKVAAKSLEIVDEDDNRTASLGGSGERPQENGGEQQPSGWNKVKKVRIQKAKRPSKLQLTKNPTPRLIAVAKQAQSIYLREGESHQVWRPKKQLSEKVEKLNQELKEEERQPSPVKAKKPPLQTPTPGKSSLRSRQKTVFKRALATQAVLKETTDELLNDADEEGTEDTKPKLSLREASKRITANLKKQESQVGVAGGANISNVVSQYLAKLRAEGGTELLSSGGSTSDAATSPLVPQPTRRRQGTRRVAFTDTPGAVELKQWKKIVRNAKTQSTQIGKQNEGGRSQTQYPLHNIPGAPQEDQTLTSSGHRKIHKTTSDSSIAKQRVGFSDHSPQPSPSPRATKSPGVIEFAHQPLAKRDSNEIHKQSKMAEMKAALKNRPSRPSIPRQDEHVSELLGSISIESGDTETDGSHIQVVDKSKATKQQTKSEGVATASLEASGAESRRKLSTTSIDSQGRPRRGSPDQRWVQDPNERERSKTPPTSQGRPSSSSSISRQRFMKVEPAPQSAEEKGEGPAESGGSGSKSTPTMIL